MIRQKIALYAEPGAGPEVSGRWRPRFVNLLIMSLILVLTVLLVELLRILDIGSQNLIMVYILSIVIVSWITPGYTYGIIAAVASTFAYDFLVTDPRMGFGFTIGFPITLCSMLFLTIVTNTITTHMKIQAQIALEREHSAELLYEINQKLLAARDLQTIVRVTNGYIISHVRRSVIFYIRDPLLPDSGVFCPSPYDNGEASLFSSDAERKIAHGIFKNFQSTRQNILDANGKTVCYVPVASKGNILGLIGISCAEGPLSQISLTFVLKLIGQVALALELQYLSDEQNRILVDAEREKMRSTLLHAISHDLRTPLTSILGASSTILEEKDQLDRETLDSLVMDINENSQWLIRMVENLLSVTRISGDTVKLSKTLEAAEEVVAESVAIVRKRFPDWHIHVKMTDELLLVPMDATLISQVIINLLENAVKNSRSGSLILVDLKKQDNFAKFDVSDNGCGIPDQLMDNLFEAHSPGGGQSIDSARGIGIGLSICKAIIQAHGGTIMGRNREKGGAWFSFSLPLGECEDGGL